MILLIRMEDEEIFERCLLGAMMGRDKYLVVCKYKHSTDLEGKRMLLAKTTRKLDHILHPSNLALDISIEILVSNFWESEEMNRAHILAELE